MILRLIAIVGAIFQLLAFVVLLAIVCAVVNVVEALQVSGGALKTGAQETPMTYATQIDMTQRFGEVELVQLTDRASTGSIDHEVLNQAIVDADQEINGHLEGRYSLPLSSTPKILITYACDIARYRLYDDRATEQVSKRYDAAMRFLRMVAEGHLSLGLNDQSQTTAATGGPAHESEHRVFTLDSLRDFNGRF